MRESVTSSYRIALALLVTLAAAGAADAKASDPTVVRRELLGQSVLGRAIHVIEFGDPDETRRVLVVGCIHGDEPQGIRISQALASGSPPANADLWIIPTLNPDGVAAHTRQNAHGVDLNRNFPWRWQRLGSRGYRYYSGPRALSEPESRLAAQLILQVHPTLSIWFHQPYGLVDESGGDASVERRFARLVGLPFVRLPRYPGSVTSWENHVLPGSTAFVVELHPGVLSRAALGRFVHAVGVVSAP
jgi:murein peptide amidase A